HYLPSSSAETAAPLFKKIMERTLPYVEEKETSFPFIRSALDEEQQKKFLDDWSKNVKEKLEQIKQTVTEEYPHWKEKAKELIDEAVDFGRKLKDKVEELTGT